MRRPDPTLSRRTMLRFGVGGLGALVLAACGSAAPTPAPANPTTAPSGAAPTKPAESAKPAASTPAAGAKPSGGAQSGKIVFMNGIGGHGKLTEQWAKEYSDANSGVTVEPQLIPSGQQMNDKLLTLTAAGTPPDVFTFFQELVPINAAVERNLLLALDDYVRRDNYNLDEFLPQAVNLNRWKNQLYALPRDYGNQQVYYNIDLFQKKGVALPASDWTDTTWTFEKYLEAAMALTESSGGKTTQWGLLINTAWRPWASFVYSNGGAIVKADADGVATEFAIADDAAVEALQFLQDLAHTHNVAPGPDATTDLGPVEFFGTNRVGMLIGNPSQAVAFRRIKAFAWDVAPLPVGRGGKRGSGGGGTAWAIAKGTKNVEVAWGFLKYLTSAKVQLDEVAVGATTPSRKEVVSSKEFQNPDLPPKNAKSFAQAQEYVVRDPVHVHWPEVFRQVVTPNMERLFGGKADAKTVAQTIKEKGDELFKS